MFMADGTKLVRMWDTSRYPAHTLYMNGVKEGRNEFVQGIQWTTDEYLSNEAFENFGREEHVPGLTLFDQLGSLGYRGGSDDHPVAVAQEEERYSPHLRLKKYCQNRYSNHVSIA